MLYVVHHVPGVFLYIKIDDGLVKCKDLADEAISHIITVVHCSTGCAHTSGENS